jgi:hypothetical protein
MTTVEVLRETRGKIAQGWTAGATARNAAGVTVTALSPDATCYCIYGAAIAVGATIDERLAAYSVLERFTNGARVDAFNDVHIHSQAEALAWLDFGIAAAEAEAA